MRLWTFQDESSMFESKEYGLLCKKYLSKCNRIKEIDKQYCSEVDGIKTAPIYTFARLSNYPSLCVETLYRVTCALTRYYKIDFYGSSGITMYELEVPEEIIIRAGYCNSYAGADVIESGFKKFVRNDMTREDIECIIPYIESNWVVAIRKIHYSEKTNKIMCHTVKTNLDLFPAWTHLIWLQDNGYPCIKENGKFRSLTENEISERCHSIGMAGCPRYYTISEALNVCNTATCSKIKEKITKMGILRDKYDYTLILDLFPDGLRMEV